MTSSREKFEELIKAEMRKVYSETVIDHTMNPRNVGALEGADGCSTTIASGSIITELARNKSIGKAQRIGQRDVLEALGGLPEESQHCALLAANTLKTALSDYMAMQREPWKRAYRTC